MQLLVNGLIAGSLGALIAGGLALVYGYLGAFNFALGQFALLGGYVAWWMYTVVGWPLPFSIVLAAALVGCLSVVTYDIAVRKFFPLHRYLPLLTTIALSMVLDACILLLFGESPKSIVRDKQVLSFGSLTFTIEQVLLVLGTAIVVLAISWILHRTSLGRKIRASVQHPNAAVSVGISSQALIRLLFVGSGLLAAFGGIFIGVDQGLTPTFGFLITIKAYAAVIAGGRGHFAGPILCAYLLALLEQCVVGLPWWGGEYISAGYQASVALTVIILFLLVKPEGLFGTKQRFV